MARRWIPRRNTRRAASMRQRRSRRRVVGRARSTLYRRRKFARIYRTPFASDRQNACLQYIQDISLNPTSALLGATGSNVWQFSANSLYDPDVTGIGHQPMFFDNFMQVFWRYRVNYAQITVTVVNHSVNTATFDGTTSVNTPNYAYKLFIARDNTISTSEYASTINTMLEEGGQQTKWRFVAPSLTGKLPKLHHSVSPHQISNKSFRDDSLAGTSLASPEQPVYFYVGIASADGNSDPPSVYLNVRIKYFCEFFDRRAVQPQN